MPVSTTQDLQREVNELRGQVLDLGQALTDLRTETASWKRALQDAFGSAGRQIPVALRDAPADSRHGLHVIHGGAR